MSERLRCVMVGLGSRGQYLLQQVLEHPGYEVVALAEPNHQLLRQAQALTGARPVRCYTDLEEAFQQSGAQACIINTPPQLHTRHLEAAFSHNLPALVAKPMTRDFAEAKRVVEESERRKLPLVVDQQTRFDYSQRLLSMWIADGEFGKLGFGTCAIHRHRPRMDNATDENPFLWEQSVHCFNSLLVMLNRRALRVQSYQTKPSWSRYNGATVVMGVIEFEGAAHTDPVVPIQFIGSYASTVPDSELRLDFERGSVRLRENEGELAVARTGETSFQVVESVSSEEAGPLERHNLDNFYRAIRDGATVPNNGRENMRTLALVDAFIRSAREGRTVEVADVD